MFASVWISSATLNTLSEMWFRKQKIREGEYGEAALGLCAAAPAPCWLARSEPSDRCACSISFRLDQFRNPVDDSVRHGVGISGQTLSLIVVPNRIAAQPLRRSHFPLEVVAYGPNLRRPEPKIA